MRRLVLALIAVIGFAAPALAQQAPPALVGRVSLVEGALALHTADQTEWSAALVNYPVATGGAFWIDQQSRAEFRIGPQTIDIAGGTEVDVVRLDEQAMEVSVPQGRIYLRIRALSQGNMVQVDMPRGGVWLLQPGAYDIDAGTQDRPSRIAVFDGSAKFVGGSVNIAIRAGDALVVGGAAQLTASTERAAADAFDQWAHARNYRERRVAKSRYVSDEMTGYADLDEYGSWRDAPQYGAVWYPSSVPADWAPYRDGRWVWVQPWGWTWVGAEPWAFAPFHYGRWARIEGRWGWIPGRRVPHPVYAPALVAFIGDPGAGIALPGAPGPAVGWFPLGPGEVYWPSYTRNPHYIRNVNITNVNVTKITNITNVIVNRPNAAPPPQVVHQTYINRTAATVVPVKAFATAAPVRPAATLRVAPQVLTRAPVAVHPPQVAPAAARIAPARPVTAPIRPHPAAAAPNAASPAGKQPAPAAPAAQHGTPAAAPTHAPAAEQTRPATPATRRETAPPHPAAAAHPETHAAPTTRPEPHAAPAARPEPHAAPAARPEPHAAPAARPEPHAAPAARPESHAHPAPRPGEPQKKEEEHK